jgi:hypothetical protein
MLAKSNPSQGALRFKIRRIQMSQANSAVSVFLLWVGDCGYTDCKALCMQVVDKFVPVFRDLMLDAVEAINEGRSAVNIQFLMPGSSDEKNYCPSNNTSYSESDWCKGGNLHVSNISLFNSFVKKMCEIDLGDETLCDKFNREISCVDQTQSLELEKLYAVTIFIFIVVPCCYLLCQLKTKQHDEESDAGYIRQ